MADNSRPPVRIADHAPQDSIFAFFFASEFHVPSGLWTAEKPSTSFIPSVKESAITKPNLPARIGGELRCSLLNMQET